MSFSPKQLGEHCYQILNDRRIRNKIVVLCEGKIQDNQGRRSPQAYKKMANMPDANFYLACVPRWWQKPRPQFFNCGDRKDVIDTYFNLLKICDRDNDKFYLNKEKLFALVDLDLQLHKISNYYLSDTEQIFYHLYKEAQVIEEQASKSHIWITGLIHKEAYFISPDIQEIFDCSLLSPQFSDRPIKLQDIYLVICEEISDDIDLKNNFDRVIKRIDYCKNIDCTEIEKLKCTWRSKFKNNVNSEQINKLVLALLTIRKAKKYWHQITPSNDWTRTHEIFREQLSLEIGRFYAGQNCDVNNHIPYFFKTLYQFA